MAQFMRESDALSWYLESDPVLRSTVVAVAWLDRSPVWETLAGKVEQATRFLPAFRQRVVELPARLTGPRWAVDPEFDLAWHLHRMDAPAPRGPEVVLDLARREAMTGFDRSRPLWQFTLVEHLEGDRAALVMKLHHSLTDGVGAMQLAVRLFDDRRAPGRGAVAPPAPEGESPAPVGLLAEQLRWRWTRATRLAGSQLRAAAPLAVATARRPGRAARVAMDTARSIGRTVTPVGATLSPLMTARGRGRHLDVIEVDLDELKQAAASAGGSVNDGFLAAVTGGLRRYHEQRGAVVERLRVMMPISIRRPDDPIGGNRITLMRFTVPVGEPDPRLRIASIERRCRIARDERSLAYTNAIAGALVLLPPAAVGSLFKRVDFVASDVPGFTAPVYLAGAEVERYVAFGPTTGTAFNVTLLSYRGRCSTGVTIDTAAVDDPAALVGCLRAGFDEVLALGPGRRAVGAASVAAAPRTPAGAGARPAARRTRGHSELRG